MAGGWSDRVGRRGVIALGWGIYAAVYAGFARSTSLTALVCWFLTYGLFYACTEGAGKAFVADLAPAGRRGMAFGLYDGTMGVGGLVASVLFGALWSAFGAGVAFGVGAGLALAAAALLFVVV